jgi:hypothetical protein
MSSKKERMGSIGVNLSVWFGVVLAFLLPHSFIPLFPLYVLPALALYYSTKGSLLRQHSKQALIFSLLFTLVYPLIAYYGLMFTIAELGGQEAIAEQAMAQLVFGSEYSPARLAFAAAFALDQTSSHFLTVDAGAYALALMQVALLLQAFSQTLVNARRAFKQEPPHYSMFVE